MMIDQRTKQQNKAQYMYFDHVGQALNDAGMDMKKFLKSDYFDAVEIPWTKQMVKDHIWVPILKAMTGKAHTSEMTKSEVTQVYEVVNRHLSKKGIHVPFPNTEI